MNYVSHYNNKEKLFKINSFIFIFFIILMNLILKQFLIIGTCFLIIQWFQNKDDLKNKKERKTLYEKYKFSLLVSSIIGLILNLSNLLIVNEKCIETITNVSIISENDLAKPFIHTNNFGNNINKSKLSWFANKKDLSTQQIYTELPDF